MTTRYDRLSPRALWWLQNLDELDLAESCAGYEATVARVREALASFDGRGVLGIDHINFDIPTASEVIAAVHAALDEPAKD